MDDSKTENNKAIVLKAFDTLPSQISGFFQFVRDLYPGFVNNPGCGLAV
jgi:hypothetical protein